MNIKIFVSVILLFTTFNILSQDNLYTSITISPELKKNANAVVRLDETKIEIISQNRMLIRKKRVVTVLNSNGNAKVGAVFYYDGNVHIKKLEAIIYNEFGKEIKKIKKKDFRDVSRTDGISLYTDDRKKYLNYTPINYPYTVAYSEAYETSFTAYIPNWHPIDDYYLSVENSSYKISNNSGIELSIQSQKFEDYNILKHSDYSYEAKNLKALKPESYSASFTKFVPSLRVALKKFSMEGVKGTNNSWQDFGKWMNEKLLNGTQSLPQEIKDEIRALTANVEGNLEKAKIVYNFMQDKTRYISVQIGIGGWKPMLASDVNRLGYGDCKGLSNYTKALLNEVGVKSYYAIIYGGRNLRDIDNSFSSLQGNHAVLAIPNNSDYVWLECTSQTAPFGYTANFTDDRDALIITPQGGKIVHTNIYKTLDNLQTTIAKVSLGETGTIDAEIEIETRGSQYSNHEGIQNKILKDQDIYYKKYWDNINNISIESMKFKNDKDSIVFTEKVNITATKYCTLAGNRILFEPNMFNKISSAPPRYKNRKLPFEIDRGFIDVDEYEINLSEELEVEALQEDVNITNKFGEYSFSIEKKSDSILIYKRRFILNKGKFIKEDYKAFRDFWLKIVKHDKSKIVLIQKK